MEAEGNWLIWADLSKTLSSTQLKSPPIITCESVKSDSKLNILVKKLGSSKLGPYTLRSVT